MITFELNQSRLKGGQRIPKKRLETVVHTCAKALALKKNVIVSIAFVSPSQMRVLNRQWRGKDKVTDVLSFGLEEGPLMGEILISYEQAKKQALQMRHSTRDEVLFLVVHGILHLFGYDHETPKDANMMFPLQARILTSLNIDSRL